MDCLVVLGQKIKWIIVMPISRCFLKKTLVQLFDEMTGREQKTYLHSAFKSDMVLMTLSSDSYFFQKNVHGYSPEEILDLLCSTFISD